MNPGSRRASLLWLAGAVCLVVTGCSTESGEVPTSTLSAGERVGPYLVTKVSDGDTVTVEMGNERLNVRVVGINTPEVSGPYTSTECFGPQASERAKELLTGRDVWLERDPNQGRRDKYDRDLAFIWIENQRDFGLAMIQQGYAYEYTYAKSYPHQQQYRAAQAVARSQQRGLWSPVTCDGRR